MARSFTKEGKTTAREHDQQAAAQLEVYPSTPTPVLRRKVVMLSVDEVKVDPMLEKLVPRPGLTELAALETSIRSDGVRVPIHVRAADHLVMDGHTRLSICKRLSPRVEKIPAILEDVPADQDLREWVIRSAVERRQLSPWQLVRLAEPLLAIEKERARGRRFAGARIEQADRRGARGDSKGKSTDIVSQKLGLGSCGDRLEQGLAVLNSGRDDLIHLLDQGEISISGAWKILMRKERGPSTVPPFKRCLTPLMKLEEWMRSRHAKVQPDVDDLELGRQLAASLEKMAAQLKKWTKAMAC